MSEDEWPEPLGHRALQTTALLPDNGSLTREELLESQIIAQAEDYDEKIEKLKKELEQILEENKQLIHKSEAESDERERLMSDSITLRKELDELKKVHIDATDNYREKETFYKDFIQRLDRDDGEQSDITVTNTLRSEFDMKEKDMTIAALTRKANRLSQELEILKGSQGTDAESITASLTEQNEKLQQEIEQLEGFVATQQSLRKEAQSEALKLTSEVNKLKSSVDNSILDRLHEAEDRAKEAVSREALLQSELADSQRRGIAAQRMVDDLRGQLADSGATPTSTSDPSIRKELDKSIAECAMLKEKVVRLTTDLEIAQKSNVTSASRIQDIEKTHHDKIMSLEHEYAAAKSLLEVKANDLAAVKAQLAAMELRVSASNTLEADKNSLIQQLDAATTEISQLKVSSNAATSSLDFLKKALSDMEKERSNEQEAFESDMLQKATELRDIQAEKDQVRGDLTKEISKHTSRIEVLMSELETSEEQLDGKNNELAELNLINNEQAVELDALREKISELEGDSEWLQNQVAVARGDQTKQENRIQELEETKHQLATANADLESQLTKLKADNRRLIGDLRGDGGSGAALIPLPDHKGLPIAEVVQMVRVGLKSCSDITMSLEKVTTSSPSTNDECAFLLALCNKLRRMLSSTKPSPEYSQLQATHAAVEKRALTIVGKVRSIEAD
eukprot:TRINITY_DN6213_c0_g1_i2.p1 TRINITY_DN6213_c0_g1~~TRINITY_DN6213_c0_g1_i2.p1  ORF type:complete len:682 (+),score=206.32 TRINITY_DN6213_c0_g1_i2:33-2078(+)